MDVLEIATMGFFNKIEGATVCRIMSQANLGIVPASSAPPSGLALRPAGRRYRPTILTRKGRRGGLL